jgi:hypothetical protein
MFRKPTPAKHLRISRFRFLTRKRTHQIGQPNVPLGDIPAPAFQLAPTPDLETIASQ